MSGDKRVELAEKAYELGFKYEHEYRGCAQCTIAAVQDALGIKADGIYKAASGLAGGIGGCTDGVCGGYSGAVIMFGLLFGRTRGEQESEKGHAAKDYTSLMAGSIHDQFIKRFGTVTCRDIHGKLLGRPYDLRDDYDRVAFHEAGAHDDADKCCDVVGTAARWAVTAIIDELEKRGLSLEDIDLLVNEQ